MNKTHLKRILAMILCIVMSLSAFAGCGNSSQPEAAAPETQAANAPEVKEEKKEEIVITMGTNTAFHSSLPYFGSVIVDSILCGFNYDRLFHAYTNGDIQPRGADSWEVSEDRYSVTFHLSKDAKWTDGTPVTAHDYAFAVELVTNEKIKMAYYPGPYSSLAGVDAKTGFADGTPLGVEVIDDYTIKYTYKDPFVAEINMFNGLDKYVALPKHLLKDMDPATYMDWEYWKNPVSNGPLILESEIPGNELVFVANKDYHLGAPKFDKLKVILMDATNMASAMIAGDIDIAYPAPSADDIALMGAQDHIHVYQMTYPTMIRSIAINNNLIPDARVRLALNMAIDRNAAAAALGNVVPMSTPFDPSSKYYDETASIPYDPEGAKALLAEAAADGTFDPSEPLVLAVIPGVGQTLANIAQQSWQAIGLNVEQQQMENSAIVAGLRKDTVAMGTINRMLCADPTKECYAKNGGHVKPTTTYWADIKNEFIYASTPEEQKAVISKMQHKWTEEPIYVCVAAAYESYAYSDRIGNGESIGQECAQTGSIPVWAWDVKN